ncbi:MAG: hypothetical protein COB84_05155 [Rhodobacteraceae bacterium]|nr:MAG: hypothetical protein COB84_05155 [Paracoccaceae bacterium]
MIRRLAMFEMFRFASVGVGAAVVYFIGALILDQLFDFPPVSASFWAFIISAGVSFAGHRYFTFSTKQNLKRQALRFSFSTIIGVILSTFIPILLQAQPPILSYGVVFIVVPCVSFTLLKFFVFTKA